MAAEEQHHHQLQQQCKRSRVGVFSSDGDAAAAAHLAGEARQLTVAPWHHHPSSRIYRVSRASGGKDRHSKVVTAKGIRDRRVRLSVSTAIQFYDLQDRLGLDQPSKAIEWLIKAASAAIDKLPSLDGAFAEGAAPAAISQEQQMDQGAGEAQQQVTQSGCSSTSETSKGSVLSLSRMETSVKARERAGNDKGLVAEDGAGVSSSQAAASFTQLLTGQAAVTTAFQAEEKNSWRISHAADYLGQASNLLAGHHRRSAATAGFAVSAPSGAHLTSSIAQRQLASSPWGYAGASQTPNGGEHGEMTTQFFLRDQLIPATAVATPAATGDYDLGFSISSGLVNATRGTLQSNSHSQPQFVDHRHHLQRLSSQLEGAGVPFFFGTPALPPAGTTNAAENHFAAASGLQLWDGYRHSDIKEGGKN